MIPHEGSLQQRPESKRTPAVPLKEQPIPLLQAMVSKSGCGLRVITCLHFSEDGNPDCGSEYLLNLKYWQIQFSFQNTVLVKLTMSVDHQFLNAEEEFKSTLV